MAKNKTVPQEPEYVEGPLDWHLSVPCAAIACDSVAEAERALAVLAACAGYEAGAIIALGGRMAAVAYTGGRIPLLPGVTRTWLSGRVARSLGLPNPLRMPPPGAGPARHACAEIPAAPRTPSRADNADSAAPRGGSESEASGAGAQIAMF
jgi:hypothetical protein